ncbi:MAG: hypothetical protein J6S67_03590 [Methanobrevibacter sp.]|nr:hypothetical protein [Methanobrevibacter sp.]
MKHQNDYIPGLFPYDKITDKSEILFTNQFGDLTAIIVKRITHPCCYIIFPSRRYAIYSSVVNNNTLNVHGGITYRSDILNIGDGINIQGRIIGWDYAHAGDYTAYNTSGKKYSFYEIISDLVNAVEQIQKMEEYYDNV